MLGDKAETSPVTHTKLETPFLYGPGFVHCHVEIKSIVETRVAALKNQETRTQTVTAHTRYEDELANWGGGSTETEYTRLYGNQMDVYSDVTPGGSF